MTLGPAQRKELDHATDYYAAQMVQPVLDYLADRAISPEAARSSHLGYVSEPLAGHEQYAGMLVIPYRAGGHTVSFKFRQSPTGEGKKYMAPSGQHPRLYGVDALRGGHEVVAIVEGELDAIVMTHTVGVPAVGVPGANVWMKHHPRCFADLDRVLVVCDNDTSHKDGNPGQALAKKIAATIRGAHVIAPPPDMDITDWVLADGVDAVRTRLGVM